MQRKSGVQSEEIENEQDSSEEEPEVGPAWKDFHYFHQSDITGTIRPALKK